MNGGMGSAALGGVRRCFGCWNRVELVAAEVTTDGPLVCRRYCAARRRTIASTLGSYSIEVIG